MKSANKSAKNTNHQSNKNSDTSLTQENSLNLKPSKHNNIKNYLCDLKIDLNDLNHIKLIANISRFVRSFFVNTLPRYLKFGEVLRPLYNFGNCNTSIHITPINEGLSQSNLSSIINDLETERIATIKEGNEEKEKVLQYKKHEAEILRDEIATNYNKLFEVTILSTFFGHTVEHLDNICDLLGMEMSKNTITIKSAWSQQIEALKSNAPHCNNGLIRNNTFDTYGLSTLFPFISTDISHPTGIPIGINKKTNLPILIDAYNPTFNNNNFVIFGKAASGKRIAIQLLTMRSYVLDEIQSIALDSEGRYCKTAKAIDGVSITLGPTSKIIINPFEIEPETIRDDITGRERIVLNLQNKIEIVTNILMTMARGSIRSQYVNDISRKIILDIVTEEYSHAGITNNPSSLYSTQGANLVGTKITRHKKPAPTLGSWYRRLCEKAKNNINIDYKYHYEYLMKYMKDYVADLNGTITYFDGQSTFDLEQDLPFINFDMSKLDTAFLKPLAYQVLLSWLWEKYFKSNSEDKSKANKRRVIVDEAWLLLPYAEATDFLSTLAQSSSIKNISLIISSQRFEDFYKNKRLNNLLTTASIKLFMKQEDSEMKYLKETFKLTNGEENFLVNCSKGEGILHVGTNSAQTYIAPTGPEIELIEVSSNSFMIMGSEDDQ